MILLNFAQVITEYQKAQIFALTKQHIHRLIDIPCRIDQHQPLLPQVVAIADATGLSPEQWQNESILVNLPFDSTVAAALLAELYRRMKYFPPVLRLRKVFSARTCFEVAEILHLEALRESA